MPQSRLSIVVPYRDRAEQLARLLSHIALYFQRDKIDKDQPYRITVVEQEPGRPFNAGALRNIGFLLTEAESDPVCFHDVDYLPIWADYRPVNRPTRLVWHGAESVPIDESARLFINHRHELYFGGVVMMPTAVFRRLNGYSNDYWGWGYEDTDFRARCQAEGVELGFRDGTYQPLRHVNRGYQADGTPSEENRANWERYLHNTAAIQDRHAHREEGLSSLQFEITERGAILDDQGQPYPHVERVLVRI
jgi:hypothetical protein